MHPGFSGDNLGTVKTTFLAFGAPGMQEMIVIFLIVLLLFGAKKIPELARGVGKGMGEFKKAKQDFESEIKAGEEEGQRDWDSPSDESKEPGGAPTPSSEIEEEEAPSSSSKD